MGRTCRRAGEIKKNPHPKCFTALFGEQAWKEGAYVDFFDDVMKDYGVNTYEITPISDVSRAFTSR